MATKELFPPNELFDWVKQQAAFGPRRPGSPANKENEDFIFATLESFGIANVRRELVPLTYWNCEQASLLVEQKSIPTFGIPYTTFTSAEGISAPLIYAEPKVFSSKKEWRGKIVVTEITFPSLNPDLLQKLALGKYDPDNDLKDLDHPATWIRVGWHLYQWAAREGALGFVGILRDQPGGSCRMYAPYGFKEKNILDKPIPGLWTGKKDGEALIKAARSGTVAELRLTGSHEKADSYNIVAEIPGATSETLVLSTHHDSPFTSPVEDASGVAVVLGLARHFAKAPKLRRRIVVLFTSGHFYGSIGTRSFIDTHLADIVADTAIEISVEHIANEAVENTRGELVASGKTEPVGIFIPFNRSVRDLLVRQLLLQGHGRTLLLPSEGPLGDYPPTDGGDWYEAGIPVINYISNPVYLLTDDDALPWVNEERLSRVAHLFAEVITALDSLTKAEIARIDFPIRQKLMKWMKTALRAKTTHFGRKPLH